MRYSCNALACEIMMIIQDLAKFEAGTPDALFTERGRENEDGAMTGTVYKCFMLNGERRCKRIGSYRITQDGIERFPGLTKEERKICEKKGRARNDMRMIDPNLWIKTAV
jgi:hypothetical protein